MADDPIQQDISQASFAAGPAMSAANEDQQTPTALPIDRTGSGIGVHDSSGTSFGAPSDQDATAGSPQPNLPSSVTQAPKTSQPDYKESWQHKIGGVLAGGTHNATYKVNPDTGEIGVELKPKTGREEIMGAVANILSGMAAGAGQKNFAKGFSAGAQQVSQQLQQRQGQQKQDAVDNYNQQQQAKVLKAQAMHANLQMYSLAQDIGRKDKEDHDSVVKVYEDPVKDLRELNISGADQELSEDDVKKLQGTDKVAMPVNTVPRIDPATGQQAKINGIPQWNNTYIAVPKDARVPVTDEEGKPKDWVSQAQSWGIMPDKKVAPQDLRVGTAASIMHSVAALNSFSTELNNFATKMNVPPTDLKAALKADPALKGALQKFQLTAGMSTQPDIQVDALRQKDPAAAAKIANLFGPDNLEKYKNQRIDEAAAGKTAAEETARVNAKAATPEGQLEAKTKGQQYANEVQTGRKTKLEADKLEKDNEAANIPTGKIINGVDETAKASLPVPQQRALQQLMDGRMEMSPQTLRTEFGASWPTLLATIFPGDSTHEGFDSSKAKAYEKMRQDYTSGKGSFARIQASDNALGHLKQYLDSSHFLETFPGMSSLASAGAFGKEARDAANKRDAAIEFIATETAKATHGGVPDKESIKENRNLLDKWYPGSSQSAAKAIAEIIKTPLDSLQSGWESGTPFGMVSPLTHLMSPEAIQAYTQLTGEAPNFGKGRAVEPSQQTGGGGELIQNKGGQPASVPVGATPILKNGQTIGYIQNGQRTNF